jgi:hypothetical protein
MSVVTQVIVALVPYTLLVFPIPEIHLESCIRPGSALDPLASTSQKQTIALNTYDEGLFKPIELADVQVAYRIGQSPDDRK